MAGWRVGHGANVSGDFLARGVNGMCPPAAVWSSSATPGTSSTTRSLAVPTKTLSCPNNFPSRWGLTRFEAKTQRLS